MSGNGPEATRVLQMRLVVEVPDHDAAVAFYRDVLGTTEELFVDSGSGARVTILDVGRATLELSTPEQVDLIDRVEVGRRVSPGSEWPSRWPTPPVQRAGSPTPEPTSLRRPYAPRGTR